MKAKTDKRKKNGGAREGAGRPKTKPDTTTVAFRVWLDEAPFVKALVNDYLKKMRKREDWPIKPNPADQ